MDKPEDILPDGLRKPVLDAKLLLVGAGGIGCEVLKNLVLAGFNNIEVVSMLGTARIAIVLDQYVFTK